MGFDNIENQINDHLVQAWNLFISSKQTHPSDVKDFNNGIHLCQYIMGMRLLRRDYPEIYPTHLDKTID